jgi:hypothetical protein
LAPLAALGLLVVILVAIATSGRQRIKVYKPINEADRIDDWLYLPETLYAFMLIMVISAGAGPYSLDALILDMMNKHVACARPHLLFSSDAAADRQTAVIMSGPS